MTKDTQLPRAVRSAIQAGAPEPQAVPLQRSPSGRVNVWGIRGPYNDGLPMAGPDGRTWQFPTRVAAESAIRDGKHVARIYRLWNEARHAEQAAVEQAERVQAARQAGDAVRAAMTARREPDRAFADDVPTDDDLAADQAAGAADDAEGLPVPDLGDLVAADQRDAERPAPQRRQRKQRPATNDPASDDWRAMRDVVHALWRADGHMTKRPLAVIEQLVDDAPLGQVGPRTRWLRLGSYWQDEQHMTCRESAVQAIVDAKQAGVGWRALDAITRHPDVRGLHAAVQRAWRLIGQDDQ